MSSSTSMLVTGFFNTLIISVLSCILPIAVGFLWEYTVEEKSTFVKKYHFLQMLFNSLSPISLMVLIVFLYLSIAKNTGGFSRIIICSIAFSLSHLWYIISKHKIEYSPFKNMAVGSISLLISVFKWSMCVGYVGIIDIEWAAKHLYGTTYNYMYFIIPFAVSLVLLLALNYARRVMEVKMS